MVDRNTFRQERLIVKIILSIFDMVYIFRGSYQIYYALKVFDNDNHACPFMIFNVFTATIFDYVPLSLVLFIHMINFRTVVNQNFGDEK